MLASQIFPVKFGIEDKKRAVHVSMNGSLKIITLIGVSYRIEDPDPDHAIHARVR